MNCVYSFVGNLPHYSVLTVTQLRIFYDGPIYFIIEEMDSPFVPFLKNLNVTIIDYKTVIDNDFLDIVCETKLRNTLLTNLPGREWLFVRAFERFFILRNLMKLHELNDVFFIELDNLLYDNPTKWLPIFSKKDMAFMFDNVKRCSSGVSYFKDVNAISNLLKGFVDYIQIHNDTDLCLNEMDALYWYLEKHSKNDVYILPTHWKDTNISVDYTANFGDFGDSIFDSAPYGIFLFGKDYCHTEGKRIKGTKWQGSELDVTHYTYLWKTDSKGLKLPYVIHENKEYKLNNLHIHCKELHEALSLEPKSY